MPVENSLYICLGPTTGLYSTGQSLHKLKSKKSFQEDIMFDCILLNNKNKWLYVKQLFDVNFEDRWIPTESAQVLLQGRVILLVFCRLFRSNETSKIRKPSLGGE